MNTTKCPNCGEQHEIKYGKDQNGNESPLLGAVKCTSNDTLYLVHIDGKPIDKSTTVFVGGIKEDTQDTIEKYVEDFDDKYRGFELCTDVRIEDRDRLFAWLRTNLTAISEEAYKKGYIDGRIADDDAEPFYTKDNNGVIHITKQA
jgi:hypothetical protein